MKPHFFTRNHGVSQHVVWSRTYLQNSDNMHTSRLHNFRAKLKHRLLNLNLHQEYSLPKYNLFTEHSVYVDKLESSIIKKMILFLSDNVFKSIKVLRHRKWETLLTQKAEDKIPMFPFSWKFMCFQNWNKQMNVKTMAIVILPGQDVKV